MLSTALTFLQDLKQNNNREWFLKHKPEYVKIKDWFDDTVLEIIHSVGKFDESIKYLNPNDCTYRMNRDMRFSPDKTPYKTHLGAILKYGGKKNGETPGYYFQITGDGRLFVGGGWYIMDGKSLFQVRTDIQKNPDTLLKILEDKDFKKVFGELGGEKLSSSPRGFSKDDPNIELLKYKHYTAFREVDATDFSQEKFQNYIVKTFQALSPLVKYLRKIQAENLE